MPVGRRADAGAERFHERFLRGKALGEVVGAQAVRLEARELAFDQHLLGETIAPTLERLGDAADLDHVGPDAVDHRTDCVISCFISRTASRMPTNTARLTIAWPMCSSRSPFRRATGSTFT